MTTKNERAANVKRLIDEAHAQSARRDHSDRVARPDADFRNADWPKRTRDVDAPPPKEQP